MADQPVTTPPTLAFQFESGALNVRVAVVKPGKVWNVAAAAWEDWPASGNPAAAHAIIPTQFGKPGVAASLWDVQLPLSLDQIQGGGVLLYGVDNSGNFQAKIGYRGMEYLQSSGTTLYVEGGTFYIR